MEKNMEHEMEATNPRDDIGLYTGNIKYPKGQGGSAHSGGSQRRFRGSACRRCHASDQNATGFRV